MESQKVAEDSQNKNICDSRWSVVLQAQFALSDQNNFLKEEMLLSLVSGWLKDNHEFYQNTITVANLLLTLPLKHEFFALISYGCHQKLELQIG